MKKYKYYNQQFEYYIHYEYSENLCVKETKFKDSLGLNLYNYTIHNYNGDQLINSEVFGRNDSKDQIINYWYNEKGYLILEESKQINPTIVNERA